jgi:hypothetical protein
MSLEAAARQARNSLVELVSDWKRENPGGGRRMNDRAEAAIAALSAALSQQAAPPVAWRIKRIDGAYAYGDGSPLLADGDEHKVEPLYTAPMVLLPLLPTPHHGYQQGAGDGWPGDYFTADQMRDYARAAIAKATA